MSNKINFIVLLEKINVLNKLNEEIKKNIKFLNVFKDIYSEINVILVTNEDKVYCFGGNAKGVLGFGHQNFVSEFTINEELSNKQIIGFKNTLWNTFAHNSNGKLYFWGYNTFSCINSIGNGEIFKPQLTKYFINENIIDYCCGRDHILVLTSNKEVYAWGGNECGQIGNGITSIDEYEFIPLKVNEFKGEKVEAVSCGWGHSMALTKVGSVYSWGENSDGQLGINNVNKNESKPKLIQIEVGVKKISCGLNHSLLLSRNGDIYVFGCNKYKQLGIITKGEKQFSPIKLNCSEKFTDIASHYRYNISAALSENGSYYVWGYCGEEGIISKLKETQFKSFEAIFGNYLQIPSKTLTENYDVFSNGKYINNWKEIAELGNGKFGKVFEVRKKLCEYKLDENKIYAIKKVRFSEGNSSIEDSFTELMTSTIFKHKFFNKFLVKYHDAWVEQDFEVKNGIRKEDINYTIYIQMDLCDKTLSATLKEIREDSKLYSNNVLTPLGYYVMSQLFIETLKGVKYLHNHNIIHRDLKPDNILVRRETNGICIKIADFGLAKVHDNNQLHTQDKETLRYMAPEVKKSTTYDTRADIFSLGEILQELFEIGVNSNHMNHSNENFLLKSKFKNASVLSMKMKNDVYRKRPDCEQIMKQRNNWAINENEFNFEEELNILIGICDGNRSYVQNIIVAKLSNFIKRPVNTCIIL